MHMCACQGSLGSIEIVNLSSNRISGHLDGLLGIPTVPFTFPPQDASLTPPPPPLALGSWPNFTQLLLSGNSLSGSLPAGLGRLARLRLLHANFNGVSGTLPPELLTGYPHVAYGGSASDGAKGLEGVQLSGTHLSGTLPTQLGERPACTPCVHTMRSHHAANAAGWPPTAVLPAHDPCS